MAREIQLTQGKVAIVSDEDYEYLSQWKWCASLESRGTKWYAIRRARKEELAAGSSRKIRMHRVVMERCLGRPLTTEEVVDHVNHESLDNQRPNLEAIDQDENMARSNGWKGSRTWKSDRECAEETRGGGTDEVPF